MGCKNSKVMNQDIALKSKALPTELPDKFDFMYPSVTNVKEPYLYDIPFEGKDEIM